MSDEKIINYPLEIPFKDFMPGQVIQSGQFNDDMAEIEEKVNEVVEKHNTLTNETDNHISNKDNPHGVTANQVGTYSEEEIDAYFEDIRNGGLYDKSIENRVLDDDCVEARNIKNASITSIKVDSNFGSQINISKNIDITDRYTKKEVNDLLAQKVGEGTYSKEELDQMFEDVQAGQIVDGTIDVSKLKDNVGKNLDISANPSITDRYTKAEVNVLIQENGLPRDWGGLEEIVQKQHYGELPIADVMTADEFIAPLTPVLDIDVKEVVEARNGFNSLNDRVGSIESKIDVKANKITVYLDDYLHLKTIVNGVYNYSPCLQKAIDDVMSAGGGTIKCSVGNYTLYEDIYTHSVNIDLNKNKFSPLTIEGIVPVNADLYNENKNVTRFIKKQDGVILGVNYNPNNECIIPSVYRNLTIKNIAFFGGGNYNSKYTNVFDNTMDIIAIEKRNSSINIEDCLFWGVSYGIYNPKTVLGSDNYCDQSSYKRLAFSNIGTGWIQVCRCDSSIFENIYGYEVAISCKHGISAIKGESFSINNILCAGKSMHLAKDFKLVELDKCNNVKVENMYKERIEGKGFYLTGCKNILFNNISARHYMNTIGSGINNRNVTINNVYTHCEEGKVLSESDPGNYTVYNTVATPLDFDFNNTNIDVSYSNTFFRNGVHTSSGFSETTARLAPKVNTTSKAVNQHGKQYIFDVIHNGKEFVANINSGQVSFSTLFLSSNPTFSTSTGEFVFPADGIFSNLSSSFITGRRSANGVINNAYKIANNPLTVRLLNTNGEIITDSQNVAFSVIANF